MKNYFDIYVLYMFMIEEIYEALKTVFDHISKCYKMKTGHN